MCGCDCCQNRCTSTYDRPGWGSTRGTWCGCTCANCIRAFAEAAYERGEQRYAAEVEALRLERDALQEVADDAERAVGLLEAAIERVRAVPEKDRRAWFTDDRHPLALDYIDGWNDALDYVEQALEGGAE